VRFPFKILKNPEIEPIPITPVREGEDPQKGHPASVRRLKQGIPFLYSSLLFLRKAVLD
jgi:hypothetical protein